ncbi:hypothetical protein AWV79_05940 [Cupriavidus sp. UYMMa02A]|nr:hypothetical protein AWV79_05940 [Cupriavidus sp. UYMMa02A]
MILTQTVRAVLANNEFIVVQLQEQHQGSTSIVVEMAFAPCKRGNLPQLQPLTLNVPAGQIGLTALQALQQAWVKVQGCAQHHTQAVVNLEYDSFALLNQAGVLSVTGQLPLTQI